MTKTITDVINYIRQETPFLNEEKPNFNKYYRDLSKLISTKPKKEKNPNFKKYWNVSWPSETLSSIGAIVHLYDGDTYIEDVKEISISHLYPKIISLIYHNTNLYDDLYYYIFIVDNLKEIKEKLDDNENILFRIILNYFYGWMVRNEPYLSALMMYFSTTYIQSIIDEDLNNLIDIIYVDTDSIFICNTDEGNKHIKKRFSEFFDDIEEETHYSIYFIKKKHLIYFDKEPYKRKGVRTSIHFRNKQLKNITYNTFNNNLSYRNFFIKSKNPDIKYQLQQTKNKILRLKKLERISEDDN